MKRIYLLISVILFSNCGNDQSGRKNDVFEKFDPFFVNHFPKHRDNLFDRVDFFPTAEIPNSGAYSRWTYKYKNHEIFELKNLLGLDSINPVEHKNYDCFICGYSSISKAYKMDCSTGKGPIPNFYWIREKLNISGEFLSPDFLIYILDTKQGKYLADDLLRDSCGELGHGYSKGLIINEERGLVMFWVEMW